MDDRHTLQRTVDRARCILAYTAADDAAHVRRVALDTAERSGARVILYALDSAELLSSPTPTNWSAEGEHEQFRDPLGLDDLEMLGQPQLADQVRTGQERGVDVRGWVPDAVGMDDMLEYARTHGADVILLPAGMDAPNPVERLTGTMTPEEAEAESPIPVILVAEDGTLRSPD